MSKDYLKKFHGEDWHNPRGKYIREFVFGANDGLVSTLGFMAGVAGSIAVSNLVLLAGTAEVIAGTVSMALGAYISSKVQRDFFRSQIAREKEEIEKNPKKEYEEIIEIYQDKGFGKKDAENVAKIISSSKEQWLNFMITDELKMTESLENPFKIAGITGVSFILGALPVVLPFIFISDVSLAVLVSFVFAILFLILVGIGKTKITKQKIINSIFEMVIIGALAFGVGWGFGVLAEGLIV